MKFANTYWQQTPDPSYSVARRIQEGIDLAVESEAQGFDAAWFGEQHFHNYGYSPNPLMLAQAVAARTQRLRLGLSVVVLPLWDPIRLAEDIAFLDIVSGGRLEVGVGKGYQHVGFRGFGMDIEERGERFDEVLEVLLAAWSSDELVYEGKYHSYPHGVNVLPKPAQSPHPPVWFAATSDDSIRYVAKTDFRVFGSANWANKAQAKLDHELYLAEREAAGLQGDNWTYALSRQVYVIPETANREAEKEAFEKRCRFTLRHARALRFDTATYEKGIVTAGPLEREESTEELFERVLFGHPEEVVEKVLALDSEIPIDMLMAQMDFGGASNDEVRRSQELFGAEVIPAVRAAIDRPGA